MVVKSSQNPPTKIPFKIIMKERMKEGTFDIFG